MDATISGQPFHCVICLELVYKPIVQACGHLFCFWCVHQAMNSLSESYCPLCRRPYMYFPRICELLHFFLLKALPLDYGDRAREVKEDEEKRRMFSPQFKGETPISEEESKSDSLVAMVSSIARPVRRSVSPAPETSPSVVVNVSIMDGGDFSGRDAHSVEFMESSPMAGVRTSTAFYGPVVVGATAGTGIFSLPQELSPGPLALASDITSAQGSGSDAISVAETLGVLPVFSPSEAANGGSSSFQALSEEPHLSLDALSPRLPVARIAVSDSSPGSYLALNEEPGTGTSATISGAINGILFASGQRGSPSAADMIVTGSPDSLLSSLPVAGSSGGGSSATLSSIPLADYPMPDSDSMLPDQSHGDASNNVSGSTPRGNAIVTRYGANSHILQNLFRTYEFVREGLFSVASENPGICSSNSQHESCRAIGNGEVASMSSEADKQVMMSSLLPSSGTGTDIGCSSMILNVEDAAILPRLLAAACHSDFQCSVCNQLLHRPVVLNCGHAFCRMCVVLPDSVNPSCPSCQSFHPAGEPQVCLELHQFLELAFPRECAFRQEQQALQAEQRRLEKASTSMDDLEPISPSKEGSREPVHRGIGCDGCGMMPIIGRRFHCSDCPESVGYDLCGNCQKSGVVLSGRFNQRHQSDHRMIEKAPRYRNSIPRFLRESMEILQGQDEGANNMSRPHSATDGFEDAVNEPEEGGGEHSQDDGDVETYFSVVYHA